MSIEIKKMSYSDDVSKFSFSDGDYIFFHGEALDERGKFYSINNDVNAFKCVIRFEPKSSNITINGAETIKSYKLNEYVKNMSYRNILIDSTTLTVAEILLLLHSINNMQDEDFFVQIIYLEPNEYTKDKTTKSNPIDVDFSLSNNLEGFYDIRPYNAFIDSTNPEEKAEVAVLLGFEENRIGRIFEFDQNQKFISSFTPLLGLPAFNPSWENTSLIKNNRHFDRNFKELEFTGANNPFQTNEILEKIYKSKESKKLVIATLGTKPCAIGASVFLVNHFKNENNDVGILFDFPIKSKDRTKGISRIYRYTLEFSN